MNHRGILTGLAVLIAAGCGQEPAPPACTSAVTPTAGPGMQPVFDWTPRCAVQSVAVRRADAPQDPILWQAALFGPGFMPPIRYGTRPPDGAMIRNREALGPDTLYRVYVIRAFRDSEAVTDSLDFTVIP